MNKKIINITEELRKKNVSNLILNKEDEDYLLILFKIDGNLDNLTERESITIYNKIYALNNSDNITVKPLYRPKTFFIHNELASSLDRKRFKMYQYNIHSYSIQTLEETYNFPVIDDNEKVRYLYYSYYLNYYDFAIGFTKRNHLNEIKVTTDSFWKTAFIIMGTMASITEFFYPFILFVKDIIKMFCCQIKKQPLKDNEINVGNQNLELNEINV